MKKITILALALVTLLGFTGSSFALLCASDPVPAGTLLFPFVTGKFASAATPTNPSADPTAPTTLIAVTNVSSTAHIVHFVLWNDFSWPVLDWDVLLTGYDVITYNFGNIMSGYLVGTGSLVAGGQPIPMGPVPSFWAGIPSLPIPGGIATFAAGSTTPQKNRTDSLYGLCTNPTYTVPFTSDTMKQAARLPEYNMSLIYNALRKSQVIAENGWYGAFPPAYITPNWLLNRTTSENVWAYITADVVDACNHSSPDVGPFYFTTFARPVTTSLYANNALLTYYVDLGNVLIGDWFVVGAGENVSNGNAAVHVEMDNQDVANSAAYPKTIVDGASFYRYAGPECQPGGSAGDDILECGIASFSPPDPTAQDYTTGGEYFYWGNRFALPSVDYREPLPSAFAFRWMTQDAINAQTMLRVWKEFPDTYPLYGWTYIYSGLQYAYYTWDEEEHVLGSTTDCPVSPCPTIPGEINQLPLEVQEVSIKEFSLPTSFMKAGWALFAFLGSNTLQLGIPGGYALPDPNTYGTQAWFEIAYTAAGKYSIDFNAAVLGNFLCDGLAIEEDLTVPAGDATDLGDVLY